MKRSISLVAFLFLSVLVSGLTAHDDQHPIPVDGAGSVATDEPTPLQGIAVSPDGVRTYLSSADGKRLLSVETATGQVLHSADLTQAVIGVEISSDGSRLAVFFEAGAQVSLYQASDLTLIGVLSTGVGAHRGRFSGDGTRLYIAASESHTIAAYSLATLTLLNQRLFTEEPSDVAPIGDGTRLAVAFGDDGHVQLISESSLTGTDVIVVPPGSSHVGWLPLATGPGLLLVTSPVTDTITMADVTTLTVLRTVMVGRPGKICTSDALQRQALIGRAGAKVEAVNGDPMSPDFGRRMSTLFMAAGNGGFGLASSEGSLVVASADRTNVVRVRRDQLDAPPTISAVTPLQGVPGTPLTIAGQFGGALDLSVVFTAMEVPTAVLPPALLSPDRLDLTIPSEVSSGLLQIWVSLASPTAVRSGTYLAHSPMEYRVLGLEEGLDALIAQISSHPAATGAILDPFRKAKRLIEEGGDYREVMKAMAEGFRALRGSPELASLAPAAARLVRYSALTKILAVEKRLGSGNPDVNDARAALQEGDRLMAAGDLEGAVDAYLRSYVELRDALPLALALTRDQRHKVIFGALGDIHRLDGTLYSRVVQHHNHSDESAEDTSIVQEIFPLISGRPNNTFKASAEGDMCGGWTRSAFAKVKKAIKRAEQAGLEPADLEAAMAAGIQRLIARVADAIEANGGAPEPTATALRKRAAAAGGSYDGLAEVAADVEPVLAAAPRVMAMAMEMTEPECDPTLTLRVPETACLHPDAPPPGPAGSIDPNPFIIKATGNGIPMELGSKGVLLLTIVAYDGATLVYSFQSMELVNGVEKDIPWDGKDDDGKLVKLKGDSKTGKFKAVGRFICPDDTKFVDEHADFTIVQEGGLIIKPPDLNLCQSTATSETKFQYKAFRCQNGGQQEVTTKCLWSLSDKRMGTIGANTGLFIATKKLPNNRALTGKVAAVHIPTKERGETGLTISPRSGSITPAAASLCPLDVTDFDVHTTCDADGLAMMANDKDYDWKVVPKSAGTINDTGIFVALKKGQADIIATPKKAGDPGPFKATVDVGSVDAVDIIIAPLLMKVGGPSETFRVQVFCHSQKVNKAKVQFRVEGDPNNAADPNPNNAETDVNGRAETQITPRRASASVNSNEAVAKVDNVEENSKFTVVDMDLSIHNGLQGRDGGQVVLEANEETVGAVTVANQNDTDSDGTPDHLQVGGGVAGEVDLMRLDITPPQPALGGSVRLTLSSPSMNLWQESTKSTVILIRGGAIEWPVGSVPATVWVECVDPSTTLRDYNVQLDYDPMQMSDRVNATAIWVAHSRVFVTRQPGVSAPPNNLQPNVAGGLPDCNDAGIVGKVVLERQAADGSFYGWGTHTNDAGTDTFIGGRILHEFEIRPGGADTIPGVVFDSTRQIFFRDARMTSGNGTFNPARPDDAKNFPAADELPNDDTGSANDEDNTPTNNHLYAWDAPSVGLGAGALSYLVTQNTFKEFVRVRFNGVTFPDVEAIRGSRCSTKVEWHGIDYLRRDNANRFVADAANPSASGARFLGAGAATFTTVAAAGAVTEGFSARFVPATSSWTLTATGGATVTAAGVPAGGGVLWTLDLPGRTTLTITQAAGDAAFNGTSRLNYSVFNAAGTKQNGIGLGAINPLLGP